MAELIIPKHRNWPLDTVELAFDTESLTFHDIEKEIK
jgi:replicative DNA helicase